MTFGADFITGFPTETLDMFNNTLKSVEEWERLRKDREIERYLDSLDLSRKKKI